MNNTQESVEQIRDLSYSETNMDTAMILSEDESLLPNSTLKTMQETRIDVDPQETAELSDSLLKNIKHVPLSEILKKMINTILRTNHETSRNVSKTSNNNSIDKSLNVVEEHNDTGYGKEHESNSSTSVCSNVSSYQESSLSLLLKPFAGRNLITILEGTNESTFDSSIDGSLMLSKMWTKVPNLLSQATQTENSIQTDVSFESSRDTCDSTSLSMDNTIDVTNNSCKAQYNNSSRINDTDKSLDESISEFLSASDLSPSKMYSQENIESSVEIGRETDGNTDETQSFSFKVNKEVRRNSIGSITSEDSISSPVVLKKKIERGISKVKSIGPALLSPKLLKKKTKKKRKTPIIDSKTMKTATSNGDCPTMIKTANNVQSSNTFIQKTNRIKSNSSPHFAKWHSPVIVTSPIKPVRFLRHLFDEKERIGRSKGIVKTPTSRRTRLCKPVILITPASPIDDSRM